MLPADDVARELTPEGRTCNCERSPLRKAADDSGRGEVDREVQGVQVCVGGLTTAEMWSPPARDAEAAAARATRRAYGRDAAANGAAGLLGQQ